MRAALRQIDNRLANAEAKVSAVVLLVMIGAAFVQALLEVLAKRVGLDAAQRALESIGNIDHFLQTATLWLAFLGASLATHANKHIAIDVLDRLLGKGAKQVIKVVTYLVAGVVSLALTWIFLEVIVKEGSILPADMAAFQDGEEIHVCDARAEVLADNDLDRPTVFCGIRAAFSSVGIVMQASRPTFQFVVPLLFFVISLRFLVRSARYALGDFELDEDGPPTTPEMQDPGEPAVRADEGEQPGRDVDEGHEEGASNDDDSAQEESKP